MTSQQMCRRHIPQQCRGVRHVKFFTTDLYSLNSMVCAISKMPNSDVGGRLVSLAPTCDLAPRQYPTSRRRAHSHTLYNRVRVKKCPPTEGT